jgi:hypothetical protein
VPAITFDACTTLAETISPLFDPDRGLLRRVFFLNQEKSRYVSVGFYPAQNYQPLVEFGGARINPTTLTEKQVSTLSEHLSGGLCQQLCKGSGFRIKIDYNLTLSTYASQTITRFAMGGRRINFKVTESRHLQDMFYIVQNQLHYYTQALPDLLTYVNQVLSSTQYVIPNPNMSPNISHPQLYEELKAPL